MTLQYAEPSEVAIGGRPVNHPGETVSQPSQTDGANCAGMMIDNHVTLALTCH